MISLSDIRLSFFSLKIIRAYQNFSFSRAILVSEHFSMFNMTKKESDNIFTKKIIFKLLYTCKCNQNTLTHHHFRHTFNTVFIDKRKGQFKFSIIMDII